VQAYSTDVWNSQTKTKKLLQISGRLT